MNNRLLHQTTHSPSFKDAIRDPIYHSSNSNKAIPTFVTQKSFISH